jgi:hypothetical protein
MRHRETPDPNKRPGAPGNSKSRKHELNVPDDAFSREHQKPSRREINNEEPAGDTTRPVTNKDEQNVITNTDANDYPMGEHEREGG